MSRRSLRPVAILVATLGFLAPQARAAALEQADAASALRARVAAYERVWNTHDAPAVAAFFATDADMIVGNTPEVRGRDAIRAWWAGAFSVRSIRILAPDVALVDVDSKTEARAAGEDGLPTRLARGTWVMMLRDGEWRIAALRAMPAEGDARTAPGVDRK